MNQAVYFSAVLFASVLTLAGCNKKEAVASAEEQSHDVFALKIGECFNDEKPTSDSDESTSVSTVPLIECQQPHDNEVFANHDLTGSTFPSDAEMESQATSLCRSSFDGYVGKPYDDSVLSVGWITPTAESWSKQDRTVNCILYQDDTKITGSKRGAAI